MAFVGLGLDGFDLSRFRRVYSGDMIGVDMGRANSACFGVTLDPINARRWVWFHGTRETPMNDENRPLKV